MRKAVVVGAAILLAGAGSSVAWDIRMPQAEFRLGGATFGYATFRIDPLRRRAEFIDARFEGAFRSTRLAVARIAASGVSPWGSADRLVLENLSFGYGGAHYEAERAEIEGFEQASPPSGAVTAFEGISARKISIPELRLHAVQGDIRADYVFRDVLIEGVAGGKIGMFSAAGGTGTMAKPGNGPAPQFTFGPMATRGIDVAAAIRLEAAAGADAPFAQIYESASIQGVKFVFGDEGEFSIGEALAQGVAARPGERPLSEEAGQLASAAETSRDGRALAEDALRLLDRFRLGSVEARDMVFDIKPRSGRSNEPVHVRFGLVALRDMAGRRIGAVEYGGMEILADKGSFAIGRLAFQDIDFSSKPADGVSPVAPRIGESRLEGLDVVFPEGKLAIGRFVLRGLDIGSKPTGILAASPLPVAPRIDGIRLEGLSVVAPPGQVSLGLFDLGLRDYVGSIPASVTLTLRGLAVPLPADDERVKVFHDFGYDRVELEAQLDTAWNPQSRSYAVRTLSAGMAGAGRVSVSGNLGNVDPAVFTAGAEKAVPALMDARLEGLRVRVDNAGLFERVLAHVAQEQGLSEPDLRAGLGLQAAALLLSVPDQRLAAELSKAVNAFLADPKALEARLRPTAPVRLNDLAEAAQNEPETTLKTLGIEVRANP